MENSKITIIFKAIGFLLVYFAVNMIVSMIYFFICGVLEIKEAGMNTQVPTIIIIVIAILIYIKIMRVEDIDNIFKVSNFSLSFVQIITLTLLGISISLIVCYIVNMDFIASTFSSHNVKTSNLINSGNLFIVVIGTGIFVPFFEEFLFRYLILFELKQVFSKMLAILIQAVVFAVLHLNPLQIIYCFLLGILFGIVYEKTKIIFSSIILHSSISMTSILFVKLLNYQNYADYEYVLLTVGILLATISTVLFFKVKWGVSDSIPQKKMLLHEME